MVTATGLVTAAARCHLAEGVRGNRAADTVLDGDGLHGSGVGQSDGLTVEGALSGGHAAIEGVADLST